MLRQIIKGLRVLADGPAPAGAEITKLGDKQQLDYTLNGYEVHIKTSANGVGYHAWVRKGDESVLDLSHDNSALTLRGVRKKAHRSIAKHSAAQTAS